MKKLSLILLFLIVMSSFVFAQKEEKGETSETSNAVKITEFGKVTNGYIKMELDNFYVELSNNPNGTGYIINFGSAREIARVEKLIRNQINFRRFDTQRFVMVNGGKAEKLQTQFWLVPAGAEPPTPENNEELK
jgi:cell division protein FtsL